MKKALNRMLTGTLATMLFASLTIVFQGNVQAVHDPAKNQEIATKNYVDNAIAGIPESPVVLNSMGSSETAAISQKAVTDALDNTSVMIQNMLMSEINENKIPVVTTTGTNTALIATVDDWEVAIGKMLIIIPHITGISNAITLDVNNNGAKTFTCADSSGINGGFNSNAPVVTKGMPMLVVRGESEWHVLNISKPNLDFVNGTLSIENGGTGETTLANVKTALGIPSLPLSIANGGTGADNIVDARINLRISDCIPVVTTGGTNAALTATVSNWTTIADGKMLVIIPHTTGSTSVAVTLNINNEGAKALTCVDSSGANGGFTNAQPVVTQNVPLLVIRGNNQWYVVNISKPNVSSVNGVLPIENGGTGTTTGPVAGDSAQWISPSSPTASTRVFYLNARQGANVEVPTIQHGTWTPILESTGVQPTSTNIYGFTATFCRIGSIIHLAMDASFDITAAGTGIIRIGGLPMTLSLTSNRALAGIVGSALPVPSSGQHYFIGVSSGTAAGKLVITLQVTPTWTQDETWRTGSLNIKFSGWFNII